MMTMQMDMTAQLAAIPYGMAIAMGVSFIGILMNASGEEIRAAKESLRATALRCRDLLRRRHIHLVPSLSEISGAR